MISSLRVCEAERGDESVDVLGIEGRELGLEGLHADGVGEHLAEDVGLHVLSRVLQRDDGGVLPVEGAGLLGEGFDAGLGGATLFEACLKFCNHDAVWRAHGVCLFVCLCFWPGYIVPKKRNLGIHFTAGNSRTPRNFKHNAAGRGGPSTAAQARAISNAEHI